MDERFDQLYRRWYGRVVRRCRQQLGPGGDAEAMAQEAFVRAWRAWSQYAPDRPFGPWVCTIARGLCHRESAKLRRLEFEPPAAASNEDAGHEAVLHYGLDAAFRSLGPRSRRLIVLRDVEGRSYDDIARIEAVSVESVRGALKRARAAFRAAYHDVVGAPVAVAAARPGLVRRLWQQCSRSLPSLEPVAAGLVLLLAPAVPTAAPLAHPVSPVVAAPAPAAPTPATLSTVASARTPPRVDVSLDAVSTPALDVASPLLAQPGDVGRFYTFAASPNYDEDRTVFALGTTDPCNGDCGVLLKSTDGGDTWTQLPAAGLDPGTVLLPPGYPKDDRIFATGRNVLGSTILSVSADGGRTFVPVVTQPGTASTSMSPSFSSGDPRILVGATDIQPAVVYRDDTKALEPLLLPLPLGATGRRLAFGEDDSLVVAAPTPGFGWSVHRCEPAACEQVLRVSATEPLQLARRPAGALFAWNRSELHRSTDDGRTFRLLDRPGGDELHLVEVVANARGRVYARVYDRLSTRTTLYSSDDLGDTWTRLPDPPDWAVEHLTVLPDGVLLASPFPGPGPVFACSTDGGLTWASRCRRAA